MEHFLGFFIIGGVVLLLVVIFVVFRLREKKRREALKAIAEEMKFSFSPKGDAELLGTFANLHLFSQGHSRRASNVMRGRAQEINLTILDYRYTIGYGKNSHTYSQTVISFRSSSLNLPAFTLRPEHFFHKIGQIFG